MTFTRQRREVSASHLTGFGLLLVGVWLLICPSVLDYSLTNATGDAHLNEVFVGLGLILGASARMRWPLRRWGIDLSNAVLGGWLVLAPFVIGYGQAADASLTARINDVLSGGLTVILAATSLIVTLWGKARQGR